MTREEWLRDLDALVGEHVMGWRIAGRTCAVFVEGDWTVHPDSDPEGWMCYAGNEPVYQRHENDLRPTAPGPDAEGWERRMYKRNLADWESDMEAFGCSRYALGVVPTYTRSISDAWKLVEAIGDTRTVRVWKCFDGYICDSNPHDGGMEDFQQTPADTAPLAITLASLRAVGCEIPEEPDAVEGVEP